MPVYRFFALNYLHLTTKVNSIDNVVNTCMEGKILRNKYKIIKILGQDTFSETFLAKGKNRYAYKYYVIKKYRPILGNPQASQIKHIFDREANVLKILSGKNRQIPQLYEYFTDGENFYLVREWIEGITLEQKVQQQGKLSEEQVKEILISILSVLEYIHDYNIVYHQLKPSNIVLRHNILPIKNKYLPVLIYFGGVKELETVEVDRRSLVLTNQNEYTSPEQRQGRSVYQSDLYSLGLIAIYLLTGKTPAELNCDSYTKEILWQQEVPELSSSMVMAIDRAICPNIGDRFINPKQMVRALNSQSITISESLITQPEELPKEAQLKMVVILFALGLATLGIIFTLVNISLAQLFPNYNNEPLTDARLETLPQNPDISPTPKLALIPTFRVYTPLEQVVNSLGEPSQESKGYWGNSRAYLYRNFIPGVDLGYLADIETQTIRQTEITFADSVKLADIHRTIELLLLEDYSPEIEQKIERVFSTASNEQQFTTGSLDGIVQRNQENSIYIGVWDKNFHQ